MEKGNAQATTRPGGEMALDDVRTSSGSEQLFLAGMVAVIAAIMVLPFVIAYFW